MLIREASCHTYGHVFITNLRTDVLFYHSVICLNYVHMLDGICFLLFTIMTIAFHTKHSSFHRFFKRIQEIKYFCAWRKTRRTPDVPRAENVCTCGWTKMMYGKYVSNHRRSFHDGFPTKLIQCKKVIYHHDHINIYNIKLYAHTP